MEAVKRNAARWIEEFDDDVVFFKEANRRTRGTAPTTPSPPGFRNYRSNKPSRPKPRYPKPVIPKLPRPLKPKAPVKKPEKAMLADFMPATPPCSESEDWDRDISRKADAREALAAALGDI